MRKRIANVVLFVVLSLGTFAQTQQDRLTQHVYYLASDSLRGRQAGSEDAAKAAAYIVGQFEEIGVKPFYEGGFYQLFKKFDNEYKNVVAWIQGNDPMLKDEYIVIGAHYDHLGVRGDVVYNGADDNASGTAAIIEMARILKAHQDELKRSVIIAAFDAEEIGLFGSDYLSSQLDVSKVKLMMSIDMVGWLEKGKTLRLNGVKTIKNGKRLLSGEAEKIDIPIRTKDFENSILTATDTQGFATKGVATLHVTTGIKSPYHKPEDDADLIDYQGLDKVTDYLSDVTLKCATDPDFAPSGKVADIHSNKKHVFDIGVMASLNNSNLRFPNAGFMGKPRYAFNVGLTSQINMGKTFSLEIDALYDYQDAKLPSATAPFEQYSRYHQESVTVPALLLMNAGNVGFNVFVGVGGYYSRVLRSSESVNLNQYGWAWCLGFRLGKFKIEGIVHYQLNPLFVEGPNARLREGQFSLSYFL